MGYRIFFLFVLISISFSMTSNAMGGDKLAGSEWVPIENDDQFLRFEAEGRIVGHGGCNRFFGSYENFKDDQLQFGPIGATKMACPEPMMSEETEFFIALESVVSFVRDATKLSLLNSQGEEIMALRQRDWD